MSDTGTDKETRARRLLIALLFFAIALNYVDRQVLALLKPTLEVEFGWSDRNYAFLGTAFQITAAFSFLFVGWILDRFGVRRSLAWGFGAWQVYVCCRMRSFCKAVLPHLEHGPLTV